MASVTLLAEGCVSANPYLLDSNVHAFERPTCVGCSRHLLECQL